MERILLVDDEPNILEGLKRQLRKSFEIDCANNGMEAVEMVGQNYVAVICDMGMPGLNGVETLAQFREKAPATTRIMLTGNADQNVAMRAVNDGHIFRFLTKPVSREVLLSTLSEASENYHSYKQDETQATVLRITADQLQRERRQNETQKIFVSMVSHELKTPLAIIDGAARLLENFDRLRPEQIQKRVTQIRQAIIRMNDVVSSSLSFVRLDSGEYDFNMEPVDLKPLLQQLVEHHRLSHESYEIRCSINAASSIISGDPHLLRTIFSNMIGNAIKYSKDSHKVYVLCENHEPGWLRVVVVDEGIGIPAGDIPNLFKKFYRASNTAGISGTGVGLYLAKTFIELHGGSISVKSKSGTGTAITVNIPLARNSSTSTATH